MAHGRRQFRFGEASHMDLDPVACQKQRLDPLLSFQQALYLFLTLES